MLQPNDEIKPLSLERPQRARDAFIEYTITERQRKQDSETNFNQAIFDAAVNLVERKLRCMEEEGQA